MNTELIGIRLFAYGSVDWLFTFKFSLNIIYINLY